MPKDNGNVLIHRLIGNDPSAPAEILHQAEVTTSAPLLVAAAVLTGDRDHLIRAAGYATATSDRQLVALAEAHLRGEVRRLDALVRDHLCEYPDNLLASWIAGQAAPAR